MEAMDLSLKMDPSEGKSKEEGEEDNGGELVSGDNHDREVEEGCSDEVGSGVEVATAEAEEIGGDEGEEEGGGGDGSFHLHVPQQESRSKYELNELQEEMSRIREENNVLKKFVDQTMKEYCDLQMRVALIQQANDATDRQNLLSLAGNLSGEQTTACNSTEKSKEMTPSPSGGNGDDLELSLMLQTTTTGRKDSPIGRQGMIMSSKGSHLGNRLEERCKMARVDPGGVPSLSSLVSSNRSKTRVSVRARVEGATVSHRLPSTSV
ncbi:hypothetical protein SAY86_026978 [Trapa natans]|uniref:Uncharacterized protein n=1 Tax=Trapa natans TaxID=22666 RepID=A0AAN7QK11_TRANT|nr:hypothetical protein SAY86_026978 [Trapa natans]